MISKRNALIVVIAAALLVGCGPAGAPAPSSTAGASAPAASFDPNSAFEP